MAGLSDQNGVVAEVEHWLYANLSPAGSDRSPGRNRPAGKIFSKFDAPTTNESTRSGAAWKGPRSVYGSILHPQEFLRCGQNLTNYCPNGLIVIDPVDAPHFRYVELPFRRVDFVLDPANPAHGYVPTEDDSLHRINLLRAAITGSAKITEPYSMDGHWNDPRPRIAMAGDDIVMTDPNVGRLRVISAKTLEEEHMIMVEGIPYNLAVVGGSGVTHRTAETKGKA